VKPGRAREINLGYYYISHPRNRFRVVHQLRHNVLSRNCSNVIRNCGRRIASSRRNRSAGVTRYELFAVWDFVEINSRSSRFRSLRVISFRIRNVRALADRFMGNDSTDKKYFDMPKERDLSFSPMLPHHGLLIFDRNLSRSHNFRCLARRRNRIFSCRRVHFIIQDAASARIFRRSNIHKQVSWVYCKIKSLSVR